VLLVVLRTMTLFSRALRTTLTPIPSEALALPNIAEKNGSA
jgi:hypothetical protein